MTSKSSANHTSSGRSSPSVLGQIFGEGEIGRMERMGRVVRCKSIATELINAKDIPAEYGPVLAELRILLRAEYMHATQDYIQGEGTTHACSTAGAGVIAPPAAARPSAVQRILGALKWTR